MRLRKVVTLLFVIACTASVAWVQKTQTAGANVGPSQPAAVVRDTLTKRDERKA